MNDVLYVILLLNVIHVLLPHLVYPSSQEENMSDDHSLSSTTSMFVTTSLIYVSPQIYNNTDSTNYTFHIPNVDDESITYTYRNNTITVYAYTVKNYSSPQLTLKYLFSKEYYSFIPITQEALMASTIYNSYTNPIYSLSFVKTA